jgi:hypothetical protein
MKLDRGNPNLMKKAALRVNPHNTLESFQNTTGDKAHMKERTGFVPSRRDPDAVPPATNSLWSQPVYVPPKQGYVRPGANDFLTIKSRGF